MVSFTTLELYGQIVADMVSRPLSNNVITDA
jgi:hypothetical protein